MATRSNIGYVLPDGRVKSIYCHWDGYPENNGKILQEYYTSQNLVEELVDQGDLSALYPKVNPTGEHSYENPEPGICIYYGRDRGETGVSAQIVPAEDLRCNDWAYLWDGEQWLVEGFGTERQPLEDVLETL